MWTLDDLKRADMQPYKACWIIYEGHRICKLVRWHNFLNDEDAFVFIPDYEEWEKVGMVEIDGINEELRLPQYVRMKLPALLYKRYVPTSRPEWPFYMETYGMPFELGRDQWELMMYSHGRVHEDYFEMERCEVNEPVKGYKEVYNGVNAAES